MNSKCKSVSILVSTILNVLFLYLVIHFKLASIFSYGIWTTMTSTHKSVEFSLMEAGHTKFSPDWHFGLWKVSYSFSMHLLINNDFQLTMKQYL